MFFTSKSKRNFRKVFFPGSTNIHKISLRGNKLICDCLETVYDGIPCRHELCLYIKESLPVSVLNLNDRWSLPYFDPDNLAPIDGESEEEKETFEEDEEYLAEGVLFFLIS